jgi:hypothetical protein
MEKTYARPNILLLSGISREDYVPVEDIFEEKLCENIKSDFTPTVMPYDRIPAVFTSLSKWPISTNLRCWSCGFTFDDRPKFIPTYMRENEQGVIEFGVLGNTCTFNCSARWINDNMHDNAAWTARNELYWVYFYFTGYKVTKITPAPSRTELQMYGGNLTEEAFWQKLRELDPQHGLNNHTAGSILPERLRNVWSCCGIKTESENDVLDDLLDF